MMWWPSPSPCLPCSRLRLTIARMLLLVFNPPSCHRRLTLHLSPLLHPTRMHARSSLSRNARALILILPSHATHQSRAPRIARSELQPVEMRDSRR